MIFIYLCQTKKITLLDYTNYIRINLLDIKHLSMKRFAFLLASIIIPFYLQAQQLITINVSKAGSLASIVNTNKKYKIKNLKLTGEINGSDIRYLRDIAGRGHIAKESNGFKGDGTEGKLARLDLSEVKIVAGGLTYYQYPDWPKNQNQIDYYTAENQIGTYMFRGCENLTEVILPNSVELIGDDAFYDCTGLTMCIIGNSTTSIGKNAFYGCSRLTHLNIPSSVTNIATRAFGECTSLNAITLPNTLMSIGESTFTGCTSLQDVELPKSITAIGERTFYGCSSLKKVDLHDELSIIGTCAFSGCSSLTSLSLPNSVTTIGESVFAECTSLENVKLGESLTTIGQSAFYNCSALSSIVLPATTTYIDNNAFKGCYALKKIEILSEIPPMCGEHTFDSVDKESCHLYVPESCFSIYWISHTWGDFSNINNSTE